MQIILGQPSTESVNRHFECKNGHKVVSNAAPTVSWYSEASKGPPVCPFCLIDFVRQAFPMYETVAAPRVSVGHVGAVGFNPCKTANCILAYHGGNQHMNATREMFTEEPKAVIPQETHNDSQRASDSSKASPAVEPDKS